MRRIEHENITRIFGITAGVASGIAVSWLNRDDQSVKITRLMLKEPAGSRSELEREIESLNVISLILLIMASKLKMMVSHMVAKLVMNLKH